MFWTPEASMTLLAVTFRVLSVGLLVSSAVYGQSQATEQSRIQVEIQAAADKGPRFTVMNLSDKTLIACHIQFSLSSQSRPQAAMDWDPIAEGRGIDPRLGPVQLKPGQSMTLNLPHIDGAPLPDKVEVIAGVWADGETFGETDWVNKLLSHRASLVSAYEQAISLLQQGLDQGWTRDRYLAELSEKPSVLPFITLRSNLQASQNSDADPTSLLHQMRGLLSRFRQHLDLLRQVKLPASKPTDDASLR